MRKLPKLTGLRRRYHYVPVIAIGIIVVLFGLLAGGVLSLLNRASLLLLQANCSVQQHSVRSQEAKLAEYPSGGHRCMDGVERDGDITINVGLGNTTFYRGEAFKDAQLQAYRRAHGYLPSWRRDPPESSVVARLLVPLVHVP